MERRKVGRISRISPIAFVAVFAAVFALAHASVGPPEQTGKFALLGGTPKIVSKFWATMGSGLTSELNVAQYPIGSTTPILNYQRRDAAHDAHGRDSRRLRDVRPSASRVQHDDRRLHREVHQGAEPSLLPLRRQRRRSGFRSKSSASRWRAMARSQTTNPRSRHRCRARSPAPIPSRSTRRRCRRMRHIRSTSRSIKGTPSGRFGIVSGRRVARRFHQHHDAAIRARAFNGR